MLRAIFKDTNGKDGEGIYSGLSLFKYNQYDSDLSLPIVQECRGIEISVLQKPEQVQERCHA